MSLHGEAWLEPLQAEPAFMPGILPGGPPRLRESGLGLGQSSGVYGGLKERWSLATPSPSLSQALRQFLCQQLPTCFFAFLCAVAALWLLFYPEAWGGWVSGAKLGECVAGAEVEGRERLAILVQGGGPVLHQEWGWVGVAVCSASLLCVGGCRPSSSPPGEGRALNTSC